MVFLLLYTLQLYISVTLPVSWYFVLSRKQIQQGVVSGVMSLKKIEEAAERPHNVQQTCDETESSTEDLKQRSLKQTKQWEIHESSVVCMCEQSPG